MRIGVLSPVAHGTGASCISLLLALRLGQDSTERVCLTHVHPSDSTLRDISGVAGTVDKTTTPSMIVRTFQSAGSMTEQEYAQYCASVTREVDLFTCTRSGEFMSSYEDARYLANYVMEKFPHKHVVVDADEHSESAMLDVIERCEVLVFVARISNSNIEMLKGKLAQYMKKGVLSGKKVLLVFNNYQTEVVTKKELAKRIGVPVKSLFFMPLNPYIAWGTFRRKLPKVWDYIIKGDPRVAGVRLELDRMVTHMLTQKGKTKATVDKEIRLVGVKLNTPEDDKVNIPEAAVKITDSALAHAESMHQINQPVTQKPEPSQSTVFSEGLPAGFGAPPKTGFVEQPEGFGAPPKTGFVEQPEVLSAKKPKGTKSTLPKLEIPEAHPEKVNPAPVELQAAPSEGIVRKIERPVVKPIAPALPTAVLKPTTKQTKPMPQAALPTTTLSSKSTKDTQSKVIPLPTGGLQSTTLGASGGE